VIDGPDGSGLSQHPVDRLVRELIASGRAAARDEIAAIVERVASAPFDYHEVRVRVDERGASYRGIVLGARERSLNYHLVKRVAIERQWANGTTTDSYQADLRRAARHPLARLLVYQRRGGAIAATISSTDRVAPAGYWGPSWLPNLLVIYSADHGMMLSGYQFSELEAVGIPEEALWLR
jgi:hypothetical protein